MRILRTFKTLCVGFVASATLLASHQEGALQEPRGLTVLRGATFNGASIPQAFFDERLQSDDMTGWKQSFPGAQGIAFSIEGGNRVTVEPFDFEKNQEWTQHVSAQFQQGTVNTHNSYIACVGALFITNKESHGIIHRLNFSHTQKRTAPKNLRVAGFLTSCLQSTLGDKFVVEGVDEIEVILKNPSVFFKDNGSFQAYQEKAPSQNNAA
ncbi:MAG: hypothetical protein LCH26_03385 [Proteobacteria bacterium]|nr:hypothetical protein [Pseudomonadota bacterium]